MMKKTTLLLCLTASLSVFSGYHYTAETTMNDPANKNKNTLLVESWIEGLNAKIEFKENDNPMAKPGTYMITNDGGKTLYLVNPEDQTYMEWDMNQLLSLAGAMGGMVKIQFDNLKTEQLETSEGDRIHGFDTTRYKHRTSYDLNMKIMGMRRIHTVITEQEAWVTDKLTDMALGVWLRNTPPSTGDEELDKLIKAEMSKIKGFPLRTKIKTITQQWNKKRTKMKREQTSYSDMTVKTFEKTSIDKSTFKIPEDYTRTESPLSQEGNPLKGLFNRKN